MAYRWLSNWLLAGTCWAEIALRSAWMAAWLMLGLKTQTSGPNAATFASGHSEESALAAGASEAALTPVTPTTAITAAANAARRRFRAWAYPNRLAARMTRVLLVRDDSDVRTRGTLTRKTSRPRPTSPVRVLIRK